MVSWLTLLRWIFFAAVIFVIIDGSLPQLQMLLLNGRVLLTLLPLKMLMIAGLVGFALMWPQKPNEFVATTMLALGLYLAVDALYLSFGLNNSFSDVLTGYWVYYSPLVLVFLASISKIKLPNQLIVRVMLFAFVVCAPIAVAQYITGRTLLPTASSDGQFTVGAVGILGTNRVFSLFIFPGTLGMFCTFIAGLAISFEGSAFRRFPHIFLWAVAGVICYMTIIRSEFLQFAAVTFAAWVLRYRPRNVLAPLIPFAGIALGLAVFAYNMLIGGTVGAGVADSSSFVARLQEWMYYANLAFSGSLFNLLFGRGIVQSERVSSTQSAVPIDNIFLAYPLHIGIIGLIFVLAVYVAIWLDLLRRVRRTGSALDIAVAAFWSSVIGLGLYSVAIPACAAYLLLSYIANESLDRSTEPIALREMATT